MVRPGEIETVVSNAARRSGARNRAGRGLRGSRLLNGDWRARLDARAAELGFDLCRIVRSDAIPEASQRLATWLAEGMAGDMTWLHETRERRGDPRALWPEARSIVILGMNYGPEGDPLGVLAQKSSAAISVYARNRDYHDLIKGRLKMLASWLVGEAGPVGLKVFVDTAPVMEKPLAARAGLGWQGKHTNLVSRRFGSWLFLGSIFTSLELMPDAPEEDHCGACRACLDACPTAAFPAPYRLDARRCISYLTIEHKGHIPAEFRTAIGNRVYGCDDCLAVCPWNKFARLGREAKLQARDDLAAPPLADLARLDEAAFRTHFAGSPIKRIGHARFLRNLLIAIGNSGDAELRPVVVEKLADPSPLVRAMAVWAAGRLFDAAEIRRLVKQFRDQERDENVQAEWDILDVDK